MVPSIHDDMFNEYRMVALPDREEYVECWDDVHHRVIRCVLWTRKTLFSCSLVDAAPDLFRHKELLASRWQSAEPQPCYTCETERSALRGPLGRETETSFALKGDVAFICRQIDCHRQTQSSLLLLGLSSMVPYVSVPPCSRSVSTLPCLTAS